MTNVTPDNAAIWFEIPVTDMDWFNPVSETMSRSGGKGTMPPSRETNCCSTFLIGSAVKSPQSCRSM